MSNKNDLLNKINQIKTVINNIDSYRDDIQLRMDQIDTQITNLDMAGSLAYSSLEDLEKLVNELDSTPAPDPTPTPSPIGPPKVPSEIGSFGENTNEPDKYYKAPTSAGWGAALGLGTALQLINDPNPVWNTAGYVELDYMKLYAHNGIGTPTVLLNDEQFNPAGWVPGELDTRWPLWGIGGTNITEPWPKTEYFDNGLIIRPSLRTDKIFHFWQKNKSVMPADKKHIGLEVRCRIWGGALVTFGLDFWDNVRTNRSVWSKTNYDGPQSKWYYSDNPGGTPSWQIIKVNLS